MFAFQKKNFIKKSKKIAMRSATLSLGVFVVSLLAGLFVTSGAVIVALGNISVFSLLFLALSGVILFLVQIEVWEKEME